VPVAVVMVVFATIVPASATARVSRQWHVRTVKPVAVAT
jgi:hypothetical protein